MTPAELKWSRTVVVGLGALVTVVLVSVFAPSEARSEAYLAILSVMGLVAGRQTAGRAP